ncbi:hypothetical protein V2I01_35300 [Micromonospora sp. BRA006-A]|nr:hypothetical protein [Micromonospora sp. BRA006-A]
MGRRRELASAADEVTRALRERRPRWISLVGPPGSGRSRLLHEVTRAVSSVDGVPVRRRVTACPPYPCGELAPWPTWYGPGRTRRVWTARVACWRRSSPRRTTTRWRPAPWSPAARRCSAWPPRRRWWSRWTTWTGPPRRCAGSCTSSTWRRVSGAPLAVVTTCGSGSADPLPAPARRIPLEPLGPLDTGRLLRHLLDRPGGRPRSPRGWWRSSAATRRSRRRTRARNRPAYRRRAPPGGRPAGPARRYAPGGAAGRCRLRRSGRAAEVETMLGWPAGRAEPVLRALGAAGLVCPVAAGGWAVDALVARVAALRLSRAVRADFARRLRAAKDTAAGRVPERRPASRPGRRRAEVCPLGAGRSRRSGGGADRRPSRRTGPIPRHGADAARASGGARAAGAAGACRTGARRDTDRPGCHGVARAAGRQVVRRRGLAPAADRRLVVRRRGMGRRAERSVVRSRGVDRSVTSGHGVAGTADRSARAGGRNRRRTEPGGHALGLAA